MITGLRAMAISIVVVSAVAACGTSGSTVSAAPASVPSVIGSTPAITASLAPSSGPKTSQTDTDWGRIWDALPSRFPSIPGATPDESAAGGAASAVFVVQGLDAKGITTALQTALERGGYTTVGSPEPLEDGSVVLDMTGPPSGCMLQATAIPSGGLTTVRILYGAACPFG